MTTGLSIWTIYDHPTDYPEHFVARRFDGETATADTVLAADLEELRTRFEGQGLVCLARFPQDDSVIVETWM